MISVIIPTMNEEEGIADCLKSLNSQSISRKDFEIIICDGNSKDRTVEIAKQYADRIVFQKSAGIGGARRDGAKAAKGDILVFSDADTTFPKDWLKIIDQDLKENDACTGEVVFTPSDLGSSALKLWRDINYKVTEPFGYIKFVGSNIAIKADLYWEIGGHKEISALDDFDVSKRLYDAKARVIFDKRLKVYTSNRRIKAQGLVTYSVKYIPHYINYLKKDYFKLLEYSME